MHGLLPPSSQEATGYFQLGQAIALLGMNEKQAAEATVCRDLTGKLYLSKSGWLLLSVPNGLARGAFDALQAVGAELPTNRDGIFNAHASIMTAEEVAAIGADKITERGHDFHYTTGALKTCKPDGWDGVSQVWFIEIQSPELKNLRKSYGLSPLPNGHELHITIGVRKTNVLGHNAISKAPPGSDSRVSPTRAGGHAGASELAGNVGSVSQSESSSISGLWRAWDQRVSGMGDKFSSVSPRYGRPSAGAHAGASSQFSRLRAGQLLLGYATGASEKQAEQPSADAGRGDPYFNGVGGGDWYQPYHDPCQGLQLRLDGCTGADDADGNRVALAKIADVARTDALPAGMGCNCGPVNAHDMASTKTGMEHGCGTLDAVAAGATPDSLTPVAKFSWDREDHPTFSPAPADIADLPAVFAKIAAYKDELLAKLEAARKATDPNPTEAQKRSGNYPKGRLSLHGLPLTIETSKGTYRRGVSPQGKAWATLMKDDYGYIRNTLSEADGDHVDVFIGPDLDSYMVYIVDQYDPATGKFDEHKVILACRTKAQAEEVYKRNYEAGWKGFGGIKSMHLNEFKFWLVSGDTGSAAQ